MEATTTVIDWVIGIWSIIPEPVQITLGILIKIVAITIPLMLSVAYLTYFERKVIGSMQVRNGPNRVGFFGFRLWGLGQPIADAVKLMFKEIIIPTGANKLLFLIAPVLSIAPALAAWAVIPFSDEMVLADVNAGLLYVLAITSIGVYGVIIAGWASNSKYALLGAMRSAAQIVSYEIAMGFALVGVLMAAGSLNLGNIVNAQQGDLGMFGWYWLPLLPLFGVYFISGHAETNRAPFDVAAALTTIMFAGGWLSPLPVAVTTAMSDVPVLGGLLGNGLHWFFAKIAFFLFWFLWFRATFPRYRYDQIMRLGWKVFIPITIVWLLVLGLAILFELPPWFSAA